MAARLRALVLVLIVTAVAWTTRPIPGFGFLPLVDDDVNIAFNPHLGAPDAARLRWMFTDFSYVHRYMPLGWLGFAAVYARSGLDPAGFHRADLLFHAVNAVLVFVLLEQLLRRFAAAAPAPRQVLAAGAGALFWALHPLRVETTAWCSGLLYAQAGLFALVAAVARMAELRERVRGRPGRAGAWLALAALAYAASVLTYPVALFLPLALAVLDRAWLRGAAPGPRRAAALGLGLLLLLAGGGLVLTVWARGTVTTDWGRSPSLAEFGAVDRLLQAAYVVVVYIARTLCPADFPWMPLTLFDAARVRLVGAAGLLVLAGLAGACWALRRRTPFLGLGALAYAALLTPNLGLTEHPFTLADRYLYFTGVVFSAVLALALSRLAARPALAAAAVVGALVLALAAAVSRRQCEEWRDTPALQARLLRNPDPDLNHITVARSGKLRYLDGDVRGGRAIVAAELAAAPKVGGVILTWREVAPARPLTPAELATPLEEWTVAPLSVAELTLARELAAGGRTDDALLHLDATVARSPEYGEAHFFRGVLLAAYGRLPEALHDWVETVGLEGSRAPATPAEERYLARTIAQGYAAAGDAVMAERMARAAARRPRS